MMTKLALRVAIGAIAFSVACSSNGSEPAAETTAPLTYWRDMAPLFEEHCMQCHRDGGIAPFRLDDYKQAKSFATLIEHATSERSMPPWGVTTDGSCGEFADSVALSDHEIARISQWVKGGAQEGTPRTIALPDLPTLADATELETPSFLPEIQGGELAESDEYRCFALDAPVDASAFITGYEVVAGQPEIVHHVLAMLVDPDAPARDRHAPGRTNLEQMRALDDESPDRDGWPCFGMAGDGLTVAAAPVIWAPGQGVVRYPNDSGVPLLPRYKIIMQVHYNLSDPDNLGKSDQTKLRLQIVPEVKNVGLFALVDPFLDTLYDDSPVTLPAGQASTTYSWQQSAREMGLELPEAQLYGVMPHMHQLGHKYQMTVSSDNQAQCGADVQHWDFHWQRMYFYQEPLTVTQDSRISVTCDYDTSDVKTPVKPGWGTRNEMCLATLYFTVPLSALSEQ